MCPCGFPLGSPISAHLPKNAIEKIYQTLTCNVTARKMVSAWYLHDHANCLTNMAKWEIRKTFIWNLSNVVSDLIRYKEFCTISQVGTPAMECKSIPLHSNNSVCVSVRWDVMKIIPLWILDMQLHNRKCFIMVYVRLTACSHSQQLFFLYVEDSARIPNSKVFF